MSNEGKVSDESLDVKVVQAINTVVDEVTADILDRQYDAEKVATARDSGQYVVLFEGVRRRLGQEIYKRGGLSEKDLVQTVRKVVEPWREKIRNTAEMRATHTSDPDEYEMEYWRKENPDDRKMKKGIPGDKTSATIDNLEPGLWLVRIRGRNNAGPGPWSETAEVMVKQKR